MSLRKISINILLALVLLVPAGTIAQTEQLLKSNNNVSNTDPYCGDDGYLESALGVKIECGITNTNMPANVSDWVLLELRAVNSGDNAGSATTGTVVARKPALLLNNGHVVDAEEYQMPDMCNGNFAESNTGNCPPVEFDFADNNQILNMDLYVVVRHLNHLDIISNARMTTQNTMVGTRYMYNFTELTEGETNAARGGDLGLKIENGMGAMYVGDVNQDANINAADYLQIYRDIDEGTMSKRSDLDFSGTVDNDDASSRLGENLGRTTQLP